MINKLQAIKKQINKDNKTLLLNVAGNYLVKGGAMLVSLMIMPAYMRYFESQAVLGMWFTITQLLNWIMLLDFGIGGGLRNKIVEPLKSGNRKYVTELVSSAYFSVGAIVAFFIILQAFCLDAVEWNTILGVSTDDIDEKILLKMVHILTVGICFRFFTVLVSQILYALQKATMPGFINLISSALIMLYLVFAKPTGTPNDIIRLAYVNSISNNAPAVIATIWVFATKLKGMYPRLSAVKIKAVKEVLGTGGTLFYLQIVLMLLFNVKEIYINWFIGAEEVVEYQVYYKLIGMIGCLFSLALNPIWSAVTKAIAEKKYRWVKHLYRRCLYLVGLFCVAQLLFIALMPWIVKIWLGKQAIEVSRIYGLIFCFYNVIYMLTMLNYNFACGMNQTKTITFWLTFASISNLLLTVWGSQLVQSWVITIIASAIAAIPCTIFVRRDLYSVISSLNDDI